MFEIGWTELLVIAVTAIIVVAPKDLPGMLRTVGQMIGRLRRMAGDFQKTFNDAVKDVEREAGVEDIRKEIDSVRKINPIDDLKKEIEFNPNEEKNKKNLELSSTNLENSEDSHLDKPLTRTVSKKDPGVKKSQKPAKTAKKTSSPKRKTGSESKSDKKTIKPKPRAKPKPRKTKSTNQDEKKVLVVE